MKRIFAALLTFAIGVLGFNLLHLEKIPSNMNEKLISTQVAPIPPIPATNNLIVSSKKEVEETPKAFFNSFEYDKNKTDPTDEYIVQSFGGWFRPDEFRGMPEVWTILLSRDSEHPQTQKFQWDAMILTNLKDGSSDDAADFSSSWIKTENNKLSFRTKKYHHVEYKFEGEFFKNGKNFAEEEKVLKGTLQKFVRGKKVAEFTSDFAYFEPRCFH